MGHWTLWLSDLRGLQISLSKPSFSSSTSSFLILACLSQGFCWIQFEGTLDLQHVGNRVWPGLAWPGPFFSCCEAGMRWMCKWIWMWTFEAEAEALALALSFWIFSFQILFGCLQDGDCVLLYFDFLLCFALLCCVFQLYLCLLCRRRRRRRRRPSVLLFMSRLFFRIS